MINAKMDKKHKYMYGWSYDAKEASTTKVVEYNYDPEVLHKIIKWMPLSLWKIISGYTSEIKKAIFELWDAENGVYFENGYLKAKNCNWYSEYSYGTCWFRGCKIWLTPKSGYIFKNLPRLGNILCNIAKSRIEPLKQEMGKQFGQHRKKLKHSSKDYDSHEQSFREGSPKELIENIQNGIKRKTAGDLYNVGDPDFDNRLVEFEILRKYKLPKSTEIYLDANGNSDTENQLEGGVEIALIYDIQSLYAELEWIQEIGEKNHDVNFMWY